MFDTINHYLFMLNNNKYMAGVMMLILNIASKYINIQLTETQQQFLKGKYARQFLIFTIAWIGTRDIITSVVLTASFITLTEYLFNETSSLCILPKHMRQLYDAIDTNDDGKISEEEVKKAIIVLEKARKQKEKQQQKNNLNNFITNL